MLRTAARCAIARSTGLVGLEASDMARVELIGVYQNILTSIKGVPAGSAYRTSVEATTKYRMSVAEGTEDFDKIEAEIAGGQVEELLSVAQDELNLIDKYIEWKLWEAPMLEEA